MMNFSLVDMNYSIEYSDYNATYFSDDYQMSDCFETIIFSVIFIICCIGIPLNGIVIWLLGFQIKRNPFTVLILNLAIADFGFVAIGAIICIFYFGHFIKLRITWMVLIYLSQILYFNGLFLLTAISIDRCVSVFFPIWHRCSRPKHLSSAICALLWICSFLLIAIPEFNVYKFYYFDSVELHSVVTSVLCLPLITISTLLLFVKICLKPKQLKRGRLLVMILITLLCFLILTLPLHIYVFVDKFFEFVNRGQFSDLLYYLILGASLNSSINPVIYFWVGRKKRARNRESIKVIFQRVFREDEVPESTEKATKKSFNPSVKASF